QLPGSRRCQIVLFVSSREMRLCSVSSFSSTTFLLLTEKLFTHYIHFNPLFSRKLRAQFSTNSLLLFRFFRVVLNGRRTIASPPAGGKHFVKYF
ncbi:hypothetical protein, partial [Collimonas humicola]|uniref:hypothetical protein n=1 Tax=Collimonas humicola TaxID=2825886 RepID=UPI001B8C44F5